MPRAVADTRRASKVIVSALGVFVLGEVFVIAVPEVDDDVFLPILVPDKDLEFMLPLVRRNRLAVLEIHLEEN